MTDPATTMLPPIRRQVSVSWPPEEAFRRFTADFGTWWPSGTHSIGGSLVKRIVFECRVGGRIYEELKDGRRYEWGRITAWEPPTRVAFTWHPSREEAEAQDVDLSFRPEGGGTRVELVSAGWERLGARAVKARKGYSVGWGAVLDHWAGRWSLAMLLFGVLSKSITLYYRITGRLEAEIDKAGGRMPAGST
jgi:uncharacterized protein YndB with AHSA1/START domain